MSLFILVFFFWKHTLFTELIFQNYPSLVVSSPSPRANFSHWSQKKGCNVAGLDVGWMWVGCTFYLNPNFQFIKDILVFLFVYIGYSPKWSGAGRICHSNFINPSLERKRPLSIVLGQLRSKGSRTTQRWQLLPAPLQISFRTPSFFVEDYFAPFRKWLLDYSFWNIFKTSFPGHVLWIPDLSIWKKIKKSFLEKVFSNDFFVFQIFISEIPLIMEPLFWKDLKL